MSFRNVSFDELDTLLQQAPVGGVFHPLVPICLDSKVTILESPMQFISTVDDRLRREVDPILVLDRGVLHTDSRILKVVANGHPPVDTINRMLPERLDYVRNNLLTNHKLASYIEHDVAGKHYEVVVILLIDGLSYGDVLNWGWEVIPTFIDGPSITFKTYDGSTTLNPSIGFASIIGNPSIARRLYDLGYRTAFGYTYWQARDNVLAEYMFRGVSDNSVTNFEDILYTLQEETIPERSYIQIVREGLDGLAHSKRELRPREIDSTARSIRDDIHRLLDVLKQREAKTVVYVTADHGVLWKNEHAWEVLKQNSSRPRYSDQRPDSINLNYTVRFEKSGKPFYLYKYPYLGSTIRKNDSGVHGGLSYQESFVPFIKIEV